MIAPAFAAITPGAASVFSLRDRRLSRGLRLVCVVGAVVAICAPSAVSAQSEDVTESLIEDYDVSDSEDRSGPLPAPSGSLDTLELDWRVWQQSLAEGGSDTRKLAGVRRLAVAQGYRNALDVTWASISEMERTDRVAPSDANSTFRELRIMSPDAPYPGLAHASYLFDRAPAKLPALVGAYLEGLERSWEWLPTRFALIQLFLLALGCGLALAALAFSLGQIIRHVPVAAHDAARLLPRGVSRIQMIVFAGIFATAVGLYFRSPLATAVTLLAVATLTQRPAERIGTLFVAGVLASVPTLHASIDRAEQFPESRAHQLFRAQYERCGAECRDQLRSSLESEDATDPVVTYTLALAEIRDGSPENVRNAVQRLQSAPLDGPVAGWGENLLGSGLVALDRPDGAVDALQRAREELPDVLAPTFNLMRAHQRADRTDAAKSASERATSSDIEAVRRKNRFERRDPASWLMLEPLPPSAFVADDSPGRANAESHLTAAWRFAAGPDHPVGSAIWFAVAVVLALLVTWPLRLGDLTSDPCPRCGLAREPDDPGKTGGNPHCLPCYRTHIGGADLDYNLRNHYEEILGRNESAQTLLRRLLSVLPPGGGHALAGRVLGAILVPFLFGAGLFLGLDPGWSWTPPDMLMGRDWFGYRVLGWFFAGTAGLRALFAAKDDVRPHSDSGAGGNRG